QLAGEPPGAVCDADVQRLHSDRVARQPQYRRLSSFIEETERVHPIEPLEQPSAPFFPSVNQDLCVRAGAKLMTADLELASEIEVIVQLAVKNDPNAVGLVRHRLRPALQVDDAEAPVAQRHGPSLREVEPGAIRTTVAQPVRKRCNQWAHVPSESTME